MQDSLLAILKQKVIRINLKKVRLVFTSFLIQSNNLGFSSSLDWQFFLRRKSRYGSQAKGNKKQINSWWYMQDKFMT